MRSGYLLLDPRNSVHVENNIFILLYIAKLVSF